MEYCVFTEPQEGFSYDDQRVFAQAAEAAGFDGYFRSDHYQRMAPGSPLPGPTDAWTTLAGLARETSRIRLGTLVSSVTYRVPGILAVQVAQVDEMSGGRVELGLGTGWFEREHLSYGIPFPERRFGLLEEQLELITGMWSTPIGETYSFTGKHYQLVDSPALPKPTQDRIPVIVGGGGPKRTPAIAARFATEFNIGFRPGDFIAERFAGVRAACDAIGRDPRSLKFSVAVQTVLGETDAAVQQRADAIGHDLDTVRSRLAVVGGRDQILETVAHLRDLGAERVYFQLINQRDVEQVELLADALGISG